MEAKDAVITDVYKAVGDLEAHNLPSTFSYRQAYFVGVEAQAEISFKAGIREAVEWLKDNLVDGEFVADVLEQDFKAQGGM